MLSKHFFSEMHNKDTIDINVFTHQDLNNYYKNITIHQYGSNYCTYLPKLLTKFLHASHIRHEYHWINYNINHDCLQMGIVDGVSYYHHDCVEMMALCLNTHNLKENFLYCVWCDELDNLLTFYQSIKNYYKSIPTMYFIIPYLSADSAGIHFWNLRKLRLPKLKSILSITNKNYQYTHHGDMLATMYAYNAITSNLFKNVVNDTLYTTIAGDGIKNFRINQSMSNVMQYDIVR